MNKSKQQHPLPFPLLNANAKRPMQPVPSPFSMKSLPLFNKENQHLTVRRNLANPPANLRIEPHTQSQSQSHSHKPLNPTTKHKANPKRKHKKQTKRKIALKKSLKNADGSVPAISHPTRIVPTNLNIKELLQLHQFTPSGGSSSQLSPMKDQFDDSFKLNETSNTDEDRKSERLKSERDEYLKKEILSKPTKPVSGYQIFAKWVRNNARDQCSKKVPQTTAISQLWKKLTQNEKLQWDGKTDILKKEYQLSMKQYKQYVADAKRLGLSVPQKTTKSELQPCKIKNLLSLVPEMCKHDKESQFIISKAAEMFIQYYGSKAIAIANRPNNISNQQNNNNNSNEEVKTDICAQDCFDALNTEHKFNFLRAVTVLKTNNNNKSNNRPPKTNKGVKRPLEKINQIKTESSNVKTPIANAANANTNTNANADHISLPNTNQNNHNIKKRKLNNNVPFRMNPAMNGMHHRSYDYYRNPMNTMNPYNVYNKMNVNTNKQLIQRQRPMPMPMPMQTQPHPFQVRATLPGHPGMNHGMNPALMNAGMRMNAGMSANARMYHPHHPHHPHPFYAPQMQMNPMMHPNMYNPNNNNNNYNRNNRNIATRAHNAPKNTSQIVNVQQIFGGSDD